MRILLVTPPMTQLNTPYPATAYLKGFLHSQDYNEVFQVDASLELALWIFSKAGLVEMTQGLDKKIAKKFDPFLNVIDPAIAFLQGKDSSLAYRIANRNYLPEGPSFSDLGNPEDPLGGEFLAWGFGSLGLQDKAKLLVTRMLGDLTLLIQKHIDSRFELARYAEKLASSQAHFEPLERALKSSKPTSMDRQIDILSKELFEKYAPDVVAFTVPFPGNVYAALRMGRNFKKIAERKKQKISVVMGGGYANTELRSLSEPKVFDYVDFITLDDGERPLLNLLEFLNKKAPLESLHRTFFRLDGKVVFQTNPRAHDIPQKSLPAPNYEGLKLSEYLSILDTPNPMHRMWSDSRWNKLTLAHGCYWKKCTFCDVSLDYIGRYETEAAESLVGKIENLISQTGSRGFHFVDEAAPPSVLRALSQKLLDKQITITWWTNIRFEKSFTPELCELMARAGCVAVSGGLEVASNRLLKLMDKGVTVEQVEKVTENFSNAQIMVHAYLMYGFPTQTFEESVEALDRVRNLFASGFIQSAYWHRFGASAHAPVGMNPKAFKIKLDASPKGKFAHNDLAFFDPVQTDHDKIGKILRLALHNYMQGLELERPAATWFL